MEVGKLSVFFLAEAASFSISSMKTFGADRFVEKNVGAGRLQDFIVGGEFQARLGSDRCEQHDRGGRDTSL